MDTVAGKTPVLSSSARVRTTLRPEPYAKRPAASLRSAVSLRPAATLRPAASLRPAVLRPVHFPTQFF